jgi:hypothetical protein
MTKWNKKPSKVQENFDMEKMMRESVREPGKVKESIREPGKVKESIREPVKVKESIIELAEPFGKPVVSSEEYLAIIKQKYFKFLNTISRTSSSIDNYGTQLSTTLVKAFSWSKYTDGDVSLVKEHLTTFLNLVITCFIVYNWYFAMFFTDTNGERIKTLELSLTAIKEKSPIFHFFFKYTLCVLSMIDNFALHLLPTTVSQYVSDRRIQFILLFITIFAITNNFGFTILNSVDSTLTIGLYVCVFVLYELYCVLLDFLPDENGSIDITRLQKYMMFGSVTPLLYLMLFFVRLIWSITLIAVTSFINCAYIVIMSFLAIPIYSTYSFSTFNIVNEFIWGSKKVKGGITELVTSIIYRFLYEISFIAILVYGVIDYSKNWSKVSKMPVTINWICYALIFLFSFIAYQRFLMNGSLSAYVDEEPILEEFFKGNKASKIEEPQTRIPEVEESKINIPELDIPKIKESKINIPELDIPKIKESKIDIPEIKESKIDIPEIKESKIDIPEIKESKIDIPEIGKSSTSIKGAIGNNVKKQVINTLLNTMKNSKYKSLIPTKLISSVI